MGKYRFNPVEVEAIKYQGVESFEELKKLFGVYFFEHHALIQPGDEVLLFSTEKGTERAKKGDYIVNVGGNFYRMNEPHFQKMFMEVDG